MVTNGKSSKVAVSLCCACTQRRLRPLLSILNERSVAFCLYCPIKQCLFQTATVITAFSAIRLGSWLEKAEAIATTTIEKRA